MSVGSIQTINDMSIQSESCENQSVIGKMQLKNYHHDCLMILH